MKVLLNSSPSANTKGWLQNVNTAPSRLSRSVNAHFPTNSHIGWTIVATSIRLLHLGAFQELATLDSRILVLFLEHLMTEKSIISNRLVFLVITYLERIVDIVVADDKFTVLVHLLIGLECGSEAQDNVIIDTLLLVTLGSIVAGRE